MAEPSQSGAAERPRGVAKRPPLRVMELAGDPDPERPEPLGDSDPKLPAPVGDPVDGEQVVASAGGGDGGSHETVLKALLDVTKAEIDTEFKISERYEAKARAFFGFAIVLFAATQAFVLRSDMTALTESGRDWLQLWVCAAAVATVFAVAAVMFATLQRDDHNFDAELLFKMSIDPTVDLRQVVAQYVALLVARREANKNRLLRVRIAQIFAFIATILIAVEFALAVYYFI